MERVPCLQRAGTYIIVAGKSLMTGGTYCIRRVHKVESQNDATFHEHPWQVEDLVQKPLFRSGMRHSSSSTELVSSTLLPSTLPAGSVCRYPSPAVALVSSLASPRRSCSQLRCTSPAASAALLPLAPSSPLPPASRHPCRCRRPHRGLLAGHVASTSKFFHRDADGKMVAMRDSRIQ